MNTNQFNSVHMHGRRKLEDLQFTYKSRDKEHKQFHLSPGNYTPYDLEQLAEWCNVYSWSIHRVDMAERTLDTMIVFFTNGLQANINTYEFQDYCQKQEGKEEINADDGYTAYGDNLLRH